MRAVGGHRRHSVSDLDLLTPPRLVTGRLQPRIRGRIHVVPAVTASHLCVRFRCTCNWRDRRFSRLWLTFHAHLESIEDATQRTYDRRDTWRQVTPRMVSVACVLNLPGQEHSYLAPSTVRVARDELYEARRRGVAYRPSGHERVVPVQRWRLVGSDAVTVAARHAVCPGHAHTRPTRSSLAAFSTTLRFVQYDSACSLISLVFSLLRWACATRLSYLAPWRLCVNRVITRSCHF